MARISYLLDTNILSEPLVKRPNLGVLEQLRAHSDALAIASITWHEMLYGMLVLPAGKRRGQINDYLFQRIRPALPIIPYDGQAAHWHSEQRARLQQLGRPASFPDGQIAAIAAVKGLILVTRNTKDFSGFEGFRMEDWFSGGGAS